MSQKLVLAGGGHAHMTVLANLSRFREKGVEVTVVQPSPFHYYSGMGPGMLGQTYSPEEIRFSTRHMVEKQGCRFILDKVVHVDPREKILRLESGEPLPYDRVSFNVGSHVPRSIITDQSPNVFTVKPIEGLLAARNKILKSGSVKPQKIAVIGGGASAVEIAGNAWALTGKPGMHPAEIKIFVRRTLMADFPQSVRSRAIRSLVGRKIEIRENCEVSAISNGTIELKAGGTYAADHIFVAVGVHPSPLFMESGLTVGPDGGLLVNRYLQSIDYPDIFGGGDCIYFKDKPLDKVGVFAVRENPVLLHNLMASFENGSLMEFDPGGDYLLIFNLGDGTGIFRKKFLHFNGRLAFLLKDYIDRKFMKKFKALEK
ncbi:MAG: FAD-dependent oxidoreductase [Desulfobulbaceae bacterium]|nr:FAD-dependent oxidoreductase [Desulfobulbaceae bacterium]